MADWYGSALTNYFRVKDEDAFRAWAEAAYLCAFEEDGRFGVYSLDEYGGWPSNVEDDDAPGGERSFDIVDELAVHAAEGEIVVIIEAGAEKLRTITGSAIAFRASASGVERIALALNDIYELAAQKWGQRPNPAEY